MQPNYWRLRLLSLGAALALLTLGPCQAQDAAAPAPAAAQGTPPDASPAAPRAAALSIAPDVQPLRPFGHVIGDVITQRIALDHEGRELDPDALPELERVGNWFQRRAVRIERETAGRRWLVIDYQIINVPDELRALDLRVQRRRDIFSRYVARLGGLEGISFMPEATYGQGTRWLTVMMIDPEKNRSTPEVVRLALEARNIEARPVWKPMHMQPVFADARALGGQVASRLYEQGLCLPSGTAMSDDDVDRISQIVRDALRTH